MPTRQDRIRALFDRALEHTPEERAVYLDRACAAEPGLRADVETLLWAHDHGDEFLADRAQEQPGEAPGDRIGRYKLLQEIGEGGFGVVWMAEQVEPVRRKVALKIIKLGMDTRRVVARFEAERQALALMDHPNIAKVLDGGATDSGRPYFVMELVRGLPITVFCDQSGLDPKERILLFQKVCNAVQHAHQKGVIHRDLKPSNILVTLHDGDPVPKVIDFGIAKATNQELTQKTLFTEFRQMIGTPEYMAPEQAELSGLDVDTRADVYSLGVVLYELLTGAKPFEIESLAEKGYDEILRHIREVDPPKPSTRFSTLGDALKTVARQRRMEPEKLGRFVRGELDWIVMKALEKDRSRRYPGANALAEDLGRYLDDLPMVAGPPGTLYRMRKFAARNRTAVTSAALLFLLLLGFSVVMAIQASRIASERDRANQEMETAQQVSDFLRSLFQVANPSQAQGETITAREMLDRGAERIENELSGQPVVQARILETIGNVYRSLGAVDPAYEALQRALEIRQANLTGPHPELASSITSLASILQDRGELEESERLFRLALDMDTRLYGEEHRRVATDLNNLGIVLYDRGDLDQGNAMLRRALELRRRLLGPEHPLVAATINNLAQNVKERGHYAEAEELYLEALAHAQRNRGPLHPDVAAIVNNLAIVLRYLGKLDEAEVYRRRSTQLAEQLWGEGHPRVAANLNNLGSLLRDKGDFEGAEQAHRSALATFRRELGDGHPNVAIVTANVARDLHRQGRLLEADQLMVDAVDQLRQRFGDRHPDLVETLVDLAFLARDQEDYSRAETLFEESLALAPDVLGPRHVVVADAMVGLASTRMVSSAEGDLGVDLTLALEIYRETLPEGHWLLARGEGTYAAHLAIQGRHQDAEPLLLEAYRVLQEVTGKAAEADRVREHLVRLYEAWGQPERAAEYAKR